MSEMSARTRLAALVEAGMIMASELELEGLLQRIADLSREVISARYGAVGVLGSDGELTRFVYSGIDQDMADSIGHLPTGVGVLGAIIEEGRPLRLREISDHPRSSGFPEHHPPMHTFLGVPITVRDSIYGRLYLAEKEGAPEFSKDDERLALLFAAQAGVAIENARLHDEIGSRREQLAILEERERISKELHDGVIQSLYSVGLGLQASIGTIEAKPERTLQRIEEAINELDNVVRDVRSYIFELQPQNVSKRGMAAAITELARDFEVNTLASTRLDLDLQTCESLKADQQRNVIQICREILSNVARHAQATQLTITCNTVDRRMVFVVEDDGVGFDPASVRRGHGLNNMAQRAERLGGTFTIEHREPRGTRHMLTVPNHAGDSPHE